jgi:S-layer family protein
VENLKRLLELGAFLGLTTVALAQTPPPDGPDFLVNQYTTGNQGTSRIAVEPGGDFVVVWTAVGQEGNLSAAVMGRRFAADGSARGSEFRVNTYTTGHQVVGSVAVGAGGDFVVVWNSVQDGSGASIQGQRFDGSGNPAGGEFAVNTYTLSQQVHPEVARFPDGRFVVTWDSYGADGDRFGISARRFEASGTPLGGEFIVNSYTSSWQNESSVAADANGNFVVAWTDQTQARDGSGFAVFGQRFDSGGNRLGGEFRVNTFTDSGQTTPSVSVSPTGGFVVAFNSAPAPGDSNGGVLARRFDAAGNGLGSDFLVNTYTTGWQYGGAGMISHDPAGNFAVTWTSFAGFNDDNIVAQHFDAAGNRVGAEFTVNQQNAGHQRYATLGSDAAGRFVVTWLDRGAHDGSGYGVFARRFLASALSPAALSVDPAAGPTSNGNGVHEPGEEVDFRPAWRNPSPVAQPLVGTLDRAAGPAGAAYVITDPTADYGPIPPGSPGGCNDCYRFSVSDPPVRPAAHWDASVVETTGPVVREKTWVVHIGRSFTDVPAGSPFYRFIETLLHHGVTNGCAGSEYCPLAATSRAEMAVFVLVAKGGIGFFPPACGATPVFADVPASNPFCRWIEELARRGVVSGCGGGNYCPSGAVTREQMAVFVLRTLDPALVPPPCGTPVYNDVPPASPFCRWIEELTRRGVVTGCGGGNYCPTSPVTREQMGVFIASTFGLALYGP